jgi:Fe-S oxidoreductase/nitrate reductase gamma subunit
LAVAIPLAAVADGTPGREVFLNFGNGAITIFYLLALFATALFLTGFLFRARKYARGRGRPVEWRRMLKAMSQIASQRTVAKRDRAVGVAHFFVFWGFLVLVAATAIIAIDEDVIGLMLNRPDLQFWHGAFYQAYSLVVDVFSVGFVVGLVYLWARRARRPARLDYERVDRPDDEYDRAGYVLDDRAFIWMLLFLAISGLLLEGFRIVATDFPAFEVYSVAGWVIGRAVGFLGAEGAETARVVTWWVHSVAALLLIALIPFSKAMHMVIDVANLMVTDPDSARSLPPAPAAVVNGDDPLAVFTWKELLDFDACTKCGRCHEVCPARASGAPLSPRDLILDLRELADAHATLDLWYGPGAEPRQANGTVAGGFIATETLWACTTCMACVEACPVGIEHIPTIVQLRRRLVEMGDVEPGLQTAFQSLSRGGNSFGKSAKQRARWTRDLDLEIKDARLEPVEYLWFLGDHASFDPRAMGVTVTVARLLHDARVDFGILYEAEVNSGNDVRRAGEEGLFEMLRDQNLEALGAADYQTIVTTDPHSLNSLRHEYGLDRPVLHYTELLGSLVAEAAIRPGSLGGVATYHDPCFLGRYQEEYEAPRRLIRAAGVELHEMGRCRENSFCCGAGGGRIWMDDSGLAERPSENRIREAVALGEDVRYFVVACPKDMVMYSDAVKTTGNDGRLEVIDIAQLLERSLEVVAVG